MFAMVTKWQPFTMPTSITPIWINAGLDDTHGCGVHVHAYVHTMIKVYIMNVKSNREVRNLLLPNVNSK